MRLSDLTQKYLADPRYLSSPRSKETYDRCIGQFVAYLMNQKLENSVEQFTPENIKGFVQYLFTAGQCASTVNTALSCLSGLARYGMQHEKAKGAGYVIDTNPVDRVKRPKSEPPVAKYLALDEVRAILATECPANERLALMLIVDQPLRATEWCEAKVRDLSLDDDRVVLTVRVKGGNQRSKMLGTSAAAALIASLKLREAGKDEPLILNSLGKAYTRQTLSEMTARVARRAGITRIPVRTHVIRHTIASAAASAGASEHEIAEMLNHSGLSTVKRYVHGVRPDAALARVREAINA